MVAAAHTLVLVEGASDRCALERLAARRGRDLASDGVRVVPIGGAHAIGRVVGAVTAQHPDIRLAGLCDAGEEGEFRRGLARAGVGSAATRADLEALGFFVCVVDLEDELLRALGSSTVERVIDAQGDMRAFRTFQKQPAQQGKAPEDQLRRFMGTRGGRKVEYAGLLVDALDATHVPRPLDLLLTLV